MRRDTLILEGIVTTVNADGELNIAPMGPRVDAGMKHFTLRPFKSTQTYHNLRGRGAGVFHVVDDVLMLAQAAVGTVTPQLMTLMATQVFGYILQDACRYYEFSVNSIDDSQDRAEIEVAVVASGRLREFFGLNRAKHAVVEASILATRLHLLPRAEVMAEFAKLAVLVDKTGGSRERQAFQFLLDYVSRAPTTTNGGTA